jgi:cytochrome c
MRPKWFLPAVIVAAATLAGWGILSPAVPAAERTAPETGEADEFGGLPEGPGREEVFYTCQACHSLAIVKQQGLDRDSWDESLVWMVEEQEMDPLEPEDRKLILEYLTTHYGREPSKRRR